MKRSLYESIITNLGESQSKRLFERMAASDSLKPRLTISKFLAFGLASLIHSLTFIVALGG